MAAMAQNSIIYDIGKNIFKKKQQINTSTTSILLSEQFRMNVLWVNFFGTLCETMKSVKNEGHQ